MQSITVAAMMMIMVMKMIVVVMMIMIHSNLGNAVHHSGCKQIVTIHADHDADDFDADDFDADDHDSSDHDHYGYNDGRDIECSGDGAKNCDSLGFQALMLMMVSMLMGMNMMMIIILTVDFHVDEVDDDDPHWQSQQCIPSPPHLHRLHHLAHWLTSPRAG